MNRRGQTDNVDQMYQPDQRLFRPPFASSLAGFVPILASPLSLAACTALTAPAATATCAPVNRV